jgi:5-methylcytosine-specific restriction endonuclease McrA
MSLGSGRRSMSEKRVPAALCRETAERAGGCCEYCRSQARVAVQPFSVEHVVPKSRGGETTPDNLALACQGCNNHKYDKIEGRDPVSGDVVRLYHPRRDRWGDHFAWSDDFAFILGRTAVGRATIATLRTKRRAA